MPGIELLNEGQTLEKGASAQEGQLRPGISRGGNEWKLAGERSETALGVPGGAAVGEESGGWRVKSGCGSQRAKT